MSRQGNALRGFGLSALVGAVVFLIILAVAVLVTATRTPLYRASAQLVVAPGSAVASAPADAIRTVETLERRTVIATFARLASTDVVRDSVAAAVGVPRSRLRAFDTTASVVPNTNIIRIDTSGPDPRLAAAIANAAARSTAREAQMLYRVYSLQFVSRAEPPRRPSYPDRKRNYLVGIVLGVLFGGAAAFAAARLRPATQA